MTQKKVRKYLLVDEETYDLVTSSCIKEYLRYHPDMLGRHITHNHIVRQIAKNYIEE